MNDSSSTSGKDVLVTDNELCEMRGNFDIIFIFAVEGWQSKLISAALASIVAES
ncbi:MAG: hypothetical protein H6891_06735 [Brucellaceae bacterium]|nr:hypothetical protein [Brucellaceae bacterium]